MDIAKVNTQLTKENELLELLIETAKAFSDKKLGEEWADYLKGWQAINNDILDAKDGTSGEAELREEFKRLNAMHDSIEGSTNGANYWREMLKADIDNLKALGIS